MEKMNDKDEPIQSKCHKKVRKRHSCFSKIRKSKVTETKHSQYPIQSENYQELDSLKDIVTLKYNHTKQCSFASEEENDWKGMSTSKFKLPKSHSHQLYGSCGKSKNGEEQIINGQTHLIIENQNERNMLQQRSIRAKFDQTQIDMLQRRQFRQNESIKQRKRTKPNHHSNEDIFNTQKTSTNIFSSILSPSSKWKEKIRKKEQNILLSYLNGKFKTQPSKSSHRKKNSKRSKKKKPYICDDGKDFEFIVVPAKEEYLSLYLKRSTLMPILENSQNTLFPFKNYFKSQSKDLKPTEVKRIQIPQLRKNISSFGREKINRSNVRLNSLPKQQRAHNHSVFSQQVDRMKVSLEKKSDRKHKFDRQVPQIAQIQKNKTQFQKPSHRRFSRINKLLGNSTEKQSLSQFEKEEEVKPLEVKRQPSPLSKKIKEKQNCLLNKQTKKSQSCQTNKQAELSTKDNKKSYKSDERPIKQVTTPFLSKSQGQCEDKKLYQTKTKISSKTEEMLDEIIDLFSLKLRTFYELAFTQAEREELVENKHISKPQAKFCEIPKQMDLSNFVKNYCPRSNFVQIKDFLQSEKTKIILVEDKEVFFGQFQGGNRNGIGILLRKNYIFEGYFEDNMKKKGYQATEKGVYEGSFRNGKKNGLGEFYWNNGESYKGSWLNGRKQGEGNWKSQNGDTYEGSWLDGKVQGYGIHNSSDQKYEGQFNNFLKEGQGTEKLPNGDSYQGKFRAGKPSGIGVYKWKKGEIYQGEFKEGIVCGSGVLKTKTCVYNGQFSKGEPLGQATILFKNGNLYNGSVKDNRFDGEGTYKIKKPLKIWNGVWKNGKLQQPSSKQKSA